MPRAIPDVTESVIELLGIDADQFSRIVMISQNDFAAVLNAKTRERESLFRKLFGTQLYARAQDLLDERRRMLEGDMVAVRSGMEGEIERIPRPRDEELLATFDELMLLPDRTVRARGVREAARKGDRRRGEAYGGTPGGAGTHSPGYGRT